MFLYSKQPVVILSDPLSLVHIENNDFEILLFRLELKLAQILVRLDPHAAFHVRTDDTHFPRYAKDVIVPAAPRILVSDENEAIVTKQKAKSTSPI